MTTDVALAELKNDAASFLAFKRAMGHPYRRGEFEIERFLRFVEDRWGSDVGISLAEAVSRWCGRLPDRKAVTLGNEFGVIRQLCLYRRRRDPTSYVPEHAFAPVKESTFFPYIFSRDEIRCILAAASAHQGRFIWASMLRRLILVLYCTGLRLGEAVRLTMDDVDLDHGTLLIRNSKRRTRIVPMRDDLVAELRLYARRHLGWPPSDNYDGRFVMGPSAWPPAIAGGHADAGKPRYGTPGQAVYEQATGRSQSGRSGGAGGLQ